MPEGMPDRMSDKMSDRMPQDMPDRIPEDLSDNMPEDMSDRMPEDLPVTKCINVMVGITRSKVFFSELAIKRHCNAMTLETKFGRNPRDFVKLN